MSETKHRAKVVWRGGKKDLRAHTIALADQTLLGSCSEWWGGDPAEGTLDGPRFSGVVLRPRVAFDRPVSEEMIASLHAKVHGACFIVNSASCDVGVESARTASADRPNACMQPGEER